VQEGNEALTRLRGKPEELLCFGIAIGGRSMNPLPGQKIRDVLRGELEAMVKIGYFRGGCVRTRRKPLAENLSSTAKNYLQVGNSRRT